MESVAGGWFLRFDPAGALRSLKGSAVVGGDGYAAPGSDMISDVRYDNVRSEVKKKPVTAFFSKDSRCGEKVQKEASTLQVLIETRAPSR